MALTHPAKRRGVESTTESKESTPPLRLHWLPSNPPMTGIMCSRYGLAVPTGFEPAFPA